MTISLKNFYRRHRRKCHGAHLEGSFSGESEERRKGWKRCLCPIFVSGVFEGNFQRKATGESDWEQAREVTRVWQQLPPTPPTGKKDQEGDRERVTIERAVTVYLEEHRGSSSLSTNRMYGYIMKEFRTWSDLRGYHYLDQWTPGDVREFRASWQVVPSTSTKKITTIRSLFEYAISQEWLEKNPAKPAKGIRRRRETEETERTPFSDEELTRMLSACDRYVQEGGEWRYRWTGKDLADFILLAIYTGLRISDLVTFHIDRLQPNGECHIRTAKTGKKVFTWLPEWLQDRVRKRAALHGPLIFGDHQTSDPNVATDLWRRKLLRLWALCGPWEKPPTPHRFRHTFARLLLEKSNLTERDVAELLGNTEKIVHKHYSAWVGERQVRLTNVLRQALENAPRPAGVAASGPLLVIR